MSAAPKDDSLMQAFVAEYGPAIAPSRAGIEAFATSGKVESLAEPRRLFHRIAGVAALLGWRELGTVGGMAEDMIALALDGRIPPRPELAAILKRALAEIERAVQTASAGKATPPATALAAVAAPLLKAPIAQELSRPPSRAGTADGSSSELLDARVLVVDDDPLSARLVELSVKKAGVQVRHCRDPREALAAIDSQRPDLILLDIMMPGQDGFETFRQIRAQASVDQVPIVFITRVSDVNEKVAALELGGDDYITKPFEPHELLARVKSHILKHTAAKEQAFKDALTGAWNHRYYKQRIEADLKKSQISGQPLCLAMMDVDKFKQVNDVHGHAAGDDVLSELVQRAKNTLRKPDVVARYGGDEIALILPGTHLDDATRVMERLCDSIRSEPFPLRAGGSLNLTASIGVTMATTDDTVETFAQRADSALYESKRNGRNRVTTL